MKRLERVIANTMIDRQNERLTREALCSLVDSIDAGFVPVTLEHDPRRPPVGRVVSGFVRDREDGESEAVVVYEVFETEDDLAFPADDARELVTHEYRDGGLVVSHDWTHRLPTDQADIAAIADLFGTTPEYFGKKSLDPISVLALCGAFALGGIASGFLNALGADAWKAVKVRLGRLTARTDARKGEQLLVFRATVRSADGPSVEVNVILTDPTAQQIEEFLASGIQHVDDLVVEAVSSSEHIRQLVLSSDGLGVKLEFGVQKNCAPLLFGHDNSDAKDR